MRRRDDKPELDEFGDERGEDEGLSPAMLQLLRGQTEARDREAVREGLKAA